MNLSASQKIRILLNKKKMTISQLAEIIGSSAQNLSNKLKRDNLDESEIKKISQALNCDYLIQFKIKDTNELV